MKVAQNRRYFLSPIRFGRLTGYWLRPLKLSGSLDEGLVRKSVGGMPSGSQIAYSEIEDEELAQLSEQKGHELIVGPVLVAILISLVFLDR